MSRITAFFFLYVLAKDCFGVVDCTVKTRKQLCNDRGYPVACAYTNKAHLRNYGCNLLRCGVEVGHGLYRLALTQMNKVPDRTVCGVSNICIKGRCTRVPSNNMPTLECEEEFEPCFTSQEMKEINQLVKESECP